MKKLTLIILLISLPAFAVKEYYSISRSIRALGMGNANYGLSNDESALFYNPAGLSLYKGGFQMMLPIQFQASTNATSAISKIQNAADGGGSAAGILNQLQALQGDIYNAGFGLFPHILMKNFAVGLLLADTKMNFGIVGAEFETAVDLSLVSDTGIFVGYARSVFDPDLHIGATLKAMARAGGNKNLGILEIAQGQSIGTNLEDLGGGGGGVDLDIGAIYEVPEIPLLPFIVSSRFGLTFSNLLGSKMTISKQGATPPGLGRTMSIGGVAIIKGWQFIDNFIVAGDIADLRLGGESNPDVGARIGSFWKHVNVGVEMPMQRWFALRLGLHQGLPSIGLGLNGRVVKFDVSYYGEELGQTLDTLNHYRVAARLAFGFGSPYESAVVSSRSEDRRDEAHGFRERLEKAKDPNAVVPAGTKPTTPEADKNADDKKGESDKGAEKEAETKTEEKTDAKEDSKSEPSAEEDSSAGDSSESDADDSE